MKRKFEFTIGIPMFIIIIIISIFGGMLIHEIIFAPNIRYFKDYKDIYATHEAPVNGYLNISHDDNSITIKIVDTSE